MANSQALQAMLESMLGSRNVYYQPPESVKMSYPAIVFRRRSIENRHADNGVYTQARAYMVTVIDRDPDSPVVSRLSQLPLCKHEQHYTSGNLHHDVFSLYF